MEFRLPRDLAVRVVLDFEEGDFDAGTGVARFNRRDAGADFTFLELAATDGLRADLVKAGLTIEGLVVRDLAIGVWEFLADLTAFNAATSSSFLRVFQPVTPRR